MMENSCQDGEKIMEQNIALQFNSPDTLLVKSGSFIILKAFSQHIFIEVGFLKKPNKKQENETRQ